ncbi:MAG: hypothetical protein E6I32_15865 [Chloroflexi bacterium]|nr:MAG: hypothetical protein E6I32_15865 [Chloroflexota bacterium]
MHQKLFAYLMRDDGRVLELPTDELLVALDQLRQASTVQGQNNYSDKATVYEFLQTVKRTMRTSKECDRITESITF